MGVPISAVKARWTRIQERFAQYAPEVLTGIPAPRGSRGVQTRHLILQYIRDHPSELTPFAWSRSPRRFARP